MAGIVVEWSAPVEMVEVDEKVYQEALDALPKSFEDIMNNMPIIVNWADDEVVDGDDN